MVEAFISSAAIISWPKSYTASVDAKHENTFEFAINFISIFIDEYNHQPFRLI